VVGTYVSMTRGYAIQRRAPVSLVVNTTDRSLMIRTLTVGFTGDSVRFSSRRVCRECGLTGTRSVTVSGTLQSYVVTFNSLGVWKMARQPKRRRRQPHQSSRHW